MKKEKESSKISREDEKDNKFEGMMSDMVDIKNLTKKKSHATIITKALKITDDEEVKKTLKNKLIKLALELD